MYIRLVESPIGFIEAGSERVQQAQRAKLSSRLIAADFKAGAQGAEIVPR